MKVWSLCGSALSWHSLVSENKPPLVQQRLLRKIVDYQLLYSPYMHDIGLFHGKMGVVVALYMYAAKYHDELITEYAWDILQQIYDGIYSNMSIGLEYGLAGIGYGTTIFYADGECD